MSRVNPFSNAVAQAAQVSTSKHHEMVAVLNELSIAISESPTQNLSCRVEPGFVTNLGQEYRLIIKSIPRSIEHLLLRAHVPASGLPVMLDLYDEELDECNSPDELRDRLLKFLDRDETQEVLRTLAS